MFGGYGLGYGMGYGMGRGFMFDWTYLLILIGALICFAASMKVKSTFAQYSGMRAACGATGADIASEILRVGGMGSVRVQPVGGNLTDHFDPRNMTVNLSQNVYSSSSMSALAVAAHECGHVLQHRDSYGPYALRTSMVPVVNLGSSLSWIMILLGIFMGGLVNTINENGGLTAGAVIIRIGIVLFSLVVLFQLVTLPVEFNASRRAISILGQSGRFSEAELDAAKKVLTAAALTYVAGAASSILQLIRLVILTGGNRRR